MKIQFYKCNANGNSFIIILHFNSIDDNFFNSKNIKEICHTIDNDIVDGFITINISDKGYFMDYYNNNGSWETLCINGLRCTAMLIKNKLNKDKINISCNNKIFATKILDEKYVEVELSEPKYKTNNLKVVNLVGDFIDSGAKHFVINYQNDWPSIKTLEETSRKIRYNE